MYYILSQNIFDPVVLMDYLAYSTNMRYLFLILRPLPVTFLPFKLTTCQFIIYCVISTIFIIPLLLYISI
jgi:hypothetical protein